MQPAFSNVHILKYNYVMSCYWLTNPFVLIDLKLVSDDSES